MDVRTRRRTVDRLTRAGLCAAALTLALLLPSCEQGGVTAGSTAVETAEAPLLTASLYQSRMDVADRQIQVKLRNDGQRDLVVESMRFSLPCTPGP